MVSLFMPNIKHAMHLTLKRKDRSTLYLHIHNNVGGDHSGLGLLSLDVIKIRSNAFVEASENMMNGRILRDVEDPQIIKSHNRSLNNTLKGILDVFL